MMMGMAQIVLLLHPHGLTMWLVDDVWKGLPAQQCEARANNIIIDKRVTMIHCTHLPMMYRMIITTDVDVDGG